MRQKKVNKTFVCIILCADCISYPKFTTIKYLKTMKVSGPKPKMWAIKIKCHFHICGNRIAKCKENESFLMKIENNKHENSRADHQRNSKFWIFCLFFFVVCGKRIPISFWHYSSVFEYSTSSKIKQNCDEICSKISQGFCSDETNFDVTVNIFDGFFLHYSWTNYWMLATCLINSFFQ